MAKAKTAPKKATKTANGNGDERHLRLVDMSDIDVLLAMEQALDADGMAGSSDIVGHLDARALFPRRMVGARMPWLVYYGYIQKDKDSKPPRYFFTPEGKELLESLRLNARDQQVLERLEGRALGAMASALAARMVNGSDLQANAVRRAVEHGRLRRKAGGIR